MAMANLSLKIVSFVIIALLSLISANSDSDPLIAFRGSLSDPNNFLESWDSTLVDPCTWFHVKCNQDNRVIRVDLSMANLSGKLVPELGQLEYLQYLTLNENSISGEIPVELGNLKNLISLDLFKNKISGTIPPALGNLKSLQFFRLNDNQLTGTIPQELCSIPSLRIVDVSNNNLCRTTSTCALFEQIPVCANSLRSRKAL